MASNPSENGLTIVSWNINGIRSLTSPLKATLDSLDADIICLQEIKTTRDLMEESFVNIDGYNSYFNFSHRKNGYSGVVTYCRDRVTPIAAEEGLTGCRITLKDGVGCYDTGNFGQALLLAIDSEGRAVLTKHSIRIEDGSEKQVTVINVYCPRANPEKQERLEFKLQFYELLHLRATAILSSGCHVLIVGDINTSHRPIDHCDPGNTKEFSNVSSRLFLDRLLVNSKGNGGKFVDTFRHFHPDERDAYTCWRTTTRARDTNYGTRLDYIFSDERLVENSILQQSMLMADITGSDHCPIKAILSCTPLPSLKCPSLCSKYWPEFSGKQTSLSTFLKKTGSESENESRMFSEIPKSMERNSTLKHKAQFKQKCLKDFFQRNAKVYEKPARQEGALVEETVDKLSRKPVDAWRALLKGPKQSPLCSGHKEPCVMRTVKKAGPNYGRDFYVCAHPEGPSSNLESQCNFFQWARAVNK